MDMTQEYEYQHVMMLLGVDGPFEDPTEKVRFLKLSGKNASEIYTGTFLEGYAIVPSEWYETLRQYNWTVRVMRSVRYKLAGSDEWSSHPRKTPRREISRTLTKEERFSKGVKSGGSVQLWQHIRGVILSSEITDHKDHNPGNNSFNNLRKANPGLNSRNTIDNNGLTESWGVWTCLRDLKNPKPYKAGFTLKGKKIYAGSFPTEKLAHEAAVAKFIEVTGREPDLSHMKKQDQEVKP